MKFFARIDDKQTGPLDLAQLIEAGVRPSTYIWHKGLPDWVKAEEVPEICRAMRRALAGCDPLTGAPLNPPGLPSVREAEAIGSRENHVGEDSRDASGGQRGFRMIPEPQSAPDFSLRPQGVSVIAAILATLLCFPFTGLVAVWYAMKCRTHWKMSEDKTISPTDSADLRRRAHDDARIYRMMIGITFCIGIMMIGFAMARLGAG